MEDENVVNDTIEEVQGSNDIAAGSEIVQLLDAVAALAASVENLGITVSDKLDALSAVMLRAGVPIVETQDEMEEDMEDDEEDVAFEDLDFSFKN